MNVRNDEDTAVALLRWFDRHRRDLPWRRDPSPYRTLVSELMLQQTVVATVVPYFQRFVTRLPDFAALAGAREDEVTALWSGLGYYARARNLRRAAIAVVGEHGGVLPAGEATLRTLPGVGPYTAAAVAAIAFDQRAFALDGNAIRVLARLGAVRAPVNRPATRARLHALGLALVPARRAGDFNQAVMELGALVCTPRAPACGDCPVRPRCAAHVHGLPVDELPVKEARPARQRVRIACALVERRGRVLLVRRQPGELLAGTWALPSAVVAAGADPAGIARAAAHRLGVAEAGAIHRGSVRHVFSHRDVTADVFLVPERAGSTMRDARIQKDGDNGDDDPDRRWCAASDLSAIGISSFTRKTLAAARPGGPPDGQRKRDRSRDPA